MRARKEATVGGDVSRGSVSPPVNMLLMLMLLMLTSTDVGGAQRVAGVKNDDSCVCEVNSTLWLFPARQFEAVLQTVHTCEGSLKHLEEQLKLSTLHLPQVEALLANLTARLAPLQYLHHRGLYSPLSLRQLGEELRQLGGDVGRVHQEQNTAQTRRLSKEVNQLISDVSRLQTSDVINMKTVREKLRHLKNNVESCKSIPQDFRGDTQLCYTGLLSGISDPVTTKISPYGKNYPSGSWGKQVQEEGEEPRSSYWVQPLLSGNIHGNSLRLYQSYEDFMASTNHQDFTFAPSHTDPKSIEGPSAVLHGGALYYHCYRSADVCRYNLTSGLVSRAPLPGAGALNKFPYCYYECQASSDVDVEADESGLWAIYATLGNHGNLVVSRLAWDDQTQTLNVTQTWETRQFKKATSNAFMACGVLYATRYVNEYREEVFYAFDTVSGREDNSLALPLEKVAKGVASLSYNPNDKRLYMYNEGYLLAYDAHF